MSTTCHDPVRVQTSILSASEKRLLIWIARRLPPAVTSDHLTVLALVAMMGGGAGYWLAGSRPALGLGLATFCLAVNWFGDSLDGTLARVRGCPRPRYGFYVDHVVDAVGALFLLGGLSLSGYVNPYVAIALLVGYYLVSIEVFLATHVTSRFRMAFLKVGPTELRILLAIGNVALLLHPYSDIAGRRFLMLDVAGTIGAAGLAVAFVVSAVRTTALLYREEPLTRRRAPRPGR